MSLMTEIVLASLNLGDGVGLHACLHQIQIDPEQRYTFYDRTLRALASLRVSSSCRKEA